MKLANLTPIHSDVFVMGAGEGDRLLAGIVARPMFRIRDRKLVHAPDLEMPVQANPFQCDFGDMPGDTPHLRGGIDLLIRGSVRSPQMRPTPRMDIDIAVGGTFRHRFVVFGDRKWQKQGDQLVATEPDPISEVQLDSKNAFGGIGVHDETAVPYPHNPLGKGYYLDPGQAENQPLPNIELPNQLIQTIEDHPIPFTPGVYHGPLRQMTSLDVDSSDLAYPKINRIKPTIFNIAHPQMIIPAAQSPRPGEMVYVSNVLEGEPLQFVWPQVNLYGHIDLGERRFTYPLHVDQIGIDIDQQTVFATWRVAFKFSVIPFEQRVATLSFDASPPVPPHSQPSVAAEEQHVS